MKFLTNSGSRYLRAGGVFDSAFFLRFSGDEFARNAADLLADRHLEDAFITPSH